MGDSVRQRGWVVTVALRATRAWHRSGPRKGHKDVSYLRWLHHHLKEILEENDVVAVGVDADDHLTANVYGAPFLPDGSEHLEQLLRRDLAVAIGVVELEHPGAHRRRPGLATSSFPQTLPS